MLRIKKKYIIIIILLIIMLFCFFFNLKKRNMKNVISIAGSSSVSSLLENICENFEQ